tara:strand:+ start:551 stop:1717 length:1167 start_codon:yes stop_codon:yes gene_type:complete
MPALQNKHYFNYGGQGPLPNHSLNAITQSWQKIQELGPFTSSIWPFVANETHRTRSHLAGICGVPSHRLALTENVTSGCVLPLWGLPFKPGDRILITDSEHPGVVGACYEIAKRLDLTVDTLRIQQITNGRLEERLNTQEFLDEIEKKLFKNTRLVVISHLLWNTGQLVPIGDISQRLNNHPRKPYLLVDGAQSFGQIPIDEIASKTDIYAFTGHKWAFGPEGLGGVALSERVISDSSPTLVGWRSLKNENQGLGKYEERYHRDSRRFEIATSCIPLMSGFRASLELIEQTVTNLQRLEKIQELSGFLWEELSKIKNVKTVLKGIPPAGIVSFRIDSKFKQSKFVKLLSKRNMFIRDIIEPNCLRACVHITSTDQEIKDLIEIIKEIA